MSAAPLSLEIRPLSEGERVVDTFFAPSKTFTDILRSASWWLPAVLIILCTSVFGYTVLHKVGITTLADNMIHSMPRLEDLMQDKAQGAMLHANMEHQMSRQFYSQPITILIGGFAVGGLFLLTVNFMFGGAARYMQMVAVFWYSILPVGLWYLLIAGLLWANVNVESFLLSNPVGTNLGYYMNGASPVVVAILNCIDIFSIWIFILQGIGMARVGRISLGKGLAASAIWWIIYSGVFKVLFIALFS